MNIIFDIVNNSIVVSKAGTKKTPPFLKIKQFDYPLINLENQQKALMDAIDPEIVTMAKGEKTNSLLLGDNIIATGLEELPPLSKSKVKDAFITRFKMFFPDFEQFYVSSFELERNKQHVHCLYEMTRRNNVSSLLEILKKKEITIKNVDYFTNQVNKLSNSAIDYPSARLFVGKDVSLVVIVKGSHLYGVNVLEFGTKDLFKNDEYLNSPYNLENGEAMKFAACVKANFASNLQLSDEKILSYDAQIDVASLPREMRALKGEMLENYYIKNNFRKYSSMVGDVIETYSSAPWFLPLQSIEVVCNEEIYMHLENSLNENVGFKYIKSTLNVEKLYTCDINNNSLFTQQFKKERRQIDWSKFLSMEIGKKKKA